ncbi:MAG: DEAD/DEAH box helicase family protein [Candidatus Eisenbacteria bacterium]|nr:DEAD/DEAH box helicase family protein [Candidatus Eisenbacteria bacterium]
MSKGRASRREETPPPDWKPTQAVDNPVINDPYGEPTKHWLYKEGVPSLMDGRREASYWFKTKRTGAKEQDLFAEEERDSLPLVNALRGDVKRWRESGYRGASRVTKELLEWWMGEDRPRRLFFCQRESAETLIYLLELALPGRLHATGFKNFEVGAGVVDQLRRGEPPDLPSLVGDHPPRLIDPPSDADLLPLLRLGCKMATGSGKTIIMGMLIAWAFCNRGRNPASAHYPSGVLVCAPNLTVRKRLQVLRPEDPDNYYDAFDLVPPKYREYLNAGKVLITNWHVFAPKSEHVEGGKSYAVVNKGEETPEAFTKDRLGDLVSRLPILVLNDEGHHCWRGRPLSKKEEKEAVEGLDREKKKELSEEADTARVWLAGLDRINNSGLAGRNGGGPAPAILGCVDLSATPFYLSTSGYPEGSPFPWLVSDFGLVDAIECGIVKVPRLPVRDDAGTKDDAGRPDPRYFRLWHNITQKDLKAGDYIRRGQPKPEAIYKYAEGALATLAAQWKKHFEKAREDADGQPFVPPAMIVVCDNTDLAEVFFRKISGEQEEETANEQGKTIQVKKYQASAILPELGNTEKEQHTIRIDSDLLKKIETEEGESKDEAALRLREIIDTVGKRGGAGEQVRCIVSVSMLTEGWDANNVTHVLGVRAFGSQLLCEQVVGRGLRRMSYTPDPETGLLPPEYVDVYGIPFSLIPFKSVTPSNPPVPRTYHDIYALPDRAAFEIRMPNVESYVYALRDSGIRCDVDAMEPLIVDQEPGEVWLAPTRGIRDDEGERADAGDFVRQTRDEYYDSVRPQQLIFRLAQLILDDLLRGAEADESERGKIKLLARHQLFPEIVAIVEEYIRKKVTFRPGTDERELGLERYSRMLRERVRDNILPAVASEDRKLLPVLNSFEQYTTTANVNSKTTRPVRRLVKSHLNAAVIFSDLERRAIEVMEELDCVECFTPNDRQIGLIVPYEYGENAHNYEPDFLVRLKNGVMVMLEIKGGGGLIHAEDQVKAKNAAARKWTAAVNNLGKYGQWDFEVCEDPNKLWAILRKHCPEAGENRPFRFVEPNRETAWRDCVPLTTLQAAAGRFGEEQLSFDRFDEWAGEWIVWDGAPRFSEGMFVARVYGKSMEPMIPDGAYCLFKSPSAGTRVGKVVLVWHSGVSDPHTGGQYTVKIYESEKRGAEEGEWEHTRVILRPKNPDFEPIILEPEEENEVRVVAEFVTVVGS